MEDQSGLDAKARNCSVELRDGVAPMVFPSSPERSVRDKLDISSVYNLIIFIKNIWYYKNTIGKFLHSFKQCDNTLTKDFPVWLCVS